MLKKDFQIRIKLLLLIVVSVAFVFIEDLIIATGLFLIGLLIFISTKKSKSQTILGLSSLITGFTLLIYNVVFSPQNVESIKWFIFTINQEGLIKGMIMGLRLAGVMLISFSWLFTTSLPDIYTSLSWIKPIRPWLLSTLRGLQLFRAEIQAIVRSLLIRGLQWNSLTANVKNLLPLASAIIPRTVSVSQDSTIAKITHSGGIES